VRPSRINHGRACRLLCAAAACLILIPAGALSQTDAPLMVMPTVRVISDAAGSRLQVNGRDFMIFGINWDYIPIGQNYMFNIWAQPDDFIEAALANEMPLLRTMGVNAIRVSVGIPPRWVRYIYERYGIYTMINHPCGRYGFTLDGIWYPSVDYSNPRMREAITAEVTALVDEFRGVPGVLMWLLGNENNYGLTWSSFEIEALPKGERDAARAKYLYSLFGEITQAIKLRDPDRLVAMANGDVQYIDIIAEECKELDIFGANVYRGISARDLFQVVHDKLGLPVMFTEFGADAWNAREMREDQMTQAHYLLGQWEEICEQSSGKGRVGNALGGFMFQWSDGWWKFGQETRLDIHDTNASWPNGGYMEDFVQGGNNMNEEWWGITAKGLPDGRGLYELYPRAAYYALRDAFRLDPYAANIDLAAIRAHFSAIEPTWAMHEARGDRADMLAESLGRVRLTSLRMEFETYSTGGSQISTPSSKYPKSSLPSFLGFDHMQSFYADFQVRPTGAVTGNLSLNVLGNVPVNPIDEIYYENRGRRRTIEVDGQSLDLQGLERVKVYQASVRWDDEWFLLDGFYRTGHTHWGYEGDLFGLYRDAYYGENIDIYNAEAPVGLELSGKKGFNGLKVAFGPQLWWGANPAVMVKYRRQIGSTSATAIFQEEFAGQSSVTSSVAVPLPPSRKATLQLATSWGPLGIEAGGIWAGSNKVGETFQIAEKVNDKTYRVLIDEVRDSDALGAKGKVTLVAGRWHYYAQGGYYGIVADGGPTPTITYTDWRLKESGTGNNTNLLTGLAVNVGNFQIGPNFLWQKPMVGPIPSDVSPPGLPRNILDDPFAVRANRETVAGEILLTYDPAPATWMWAWDNDTREDASLAWSLGFVFRHFPTTMDAAIGILEDGTTTFAFPAATPPRDLWEVNARIVSVPGRNKRLVAHLFAGTGEPNGDDTRLIHRYGGDARFTWGPAALATFVKINDWGPYDYHRDFNLTFPMQLMGDVSYSLGAPKWFGFPQTRLGLRGTWRSLDRYSPRYSPDLVSDPTASESDGAEWEIRTYLHVAI